MRAIILLVLSVAWIEFVGVSEALAQARSPGIPPGVSCVSDNSGELNLRDCPVINSSGTKRCIVTGASCTWTTRYSYLPQSARLNPPGATCLNQFSDDCSGNTCYYRYGQCRWYWLRHIVGR
jgi:hypothetical protein